MSTHVRSSIFQTLFSWASLTKQLTILYAYTFVVVNYKRKYLREVLVNRLVKLAQKSLVRLTDFLNMTIAVDWNIKSQTKLDLCQETNITKAVFSEVKLCPPNGKLSRQACLLLFIVSK